MNNKDMMKNDELTKKIKLLTLKSQKRLKNYVSAELNENIHSYNEHNVSQKTKNETFS